MSNAAGEILALHGTLAGAGTLEKHGRVPLGHDGADACLKGGLPRGALHEIFSQGGHEAAASGFAAALSFRAAAKKRVLWIRREFSSVEFGELAATGLLELGLDPGQLLLLRVADAASVLRAASDALSCAALGAVVIEIPGEPKILDLVASRRLTLSSAQKGVTAFLLRFNAKPAASSAETRWHIRASPSRQENEHWGKPAFRAELLRNRHGLTGQWVMEWDCDECLFRETGDKRAADTRFMVSASVDRPAAAAVDGAATVRCVA